MLLHVLTAGPARHAVVQQCLEACVPSCDHMTAACCAESDLSSVRRLTDAGGTAKQVVASTRPQPTEGNQPAEASAVLTFATAPPGFCAPLHTTVSETDRNSLWSNNRLQMHAGSPDLAVQCDEIELDVSTVSGTALSR